MKRKVHFVLTSGLLVAVTVGCLTGQQLPAASAQGKKFKASS
jgi:hypothetical protein